MVEVPEDRVAEFHRWFGEWLDQGPEYPATIVDDSTLDYWTSDDSQIAASYWSKLSEPAKAVFEYLIERPGESISWETLAELNDMSSSSEVAGVFAWPGRYAKALQRVHPVNWQWTREGSEYWIDPDVADLFRLAMRRDTMTA